MDFGDFPEISPWLFGNSWRNSDLSVSGDNKQAPFQLWCRKTEIKLEKISKHFNHDFRDEEIYVNVLFVNDLEVINNFSVGSILVT